MNYGDIVGLEQGRRYAEARLARDLEHRRIARERAEERKKRAEDAAAEAAASKLRARDGATDGEGKGTDTTVRAAGADAVDAARVEEDRILIHS